MCGISAVVRLRGSKAVDLVGITDLLRHRGPDGEGYLFASIDDTDLPRVLTREEAIAGGRCGEWGIGLAHRRLAILDTSEAGAQPMLDGIHRRAIVHNGEIYNFVELREELRHLGYRFVTQTDTEVILAAYDAWGVDCLRHFNGMWAFVILDLPRRCLLIARDRLGIKPLYWTVNSDYFVLASEIKAFTALPWWTPKLNPQRGFEFLSFGVLDHTLETMFEGVSQVGQGEYILLNLAAQDTTNLQLQNTKWWKLPAGTTEPRPLASTANEFNQLFTDAVRIHLRSDVPIGSCLSGGLDSSSIVCVANGLLRSERAEANQRTYSAVYEDVECDERQYIDAVARACGARGIHCRPSAEMLREQFSDLVWTQDEPFATTSVFAQWCVFDVARADGVVVMLDGQGADEQLGGYHQYAAARLIDLLASGRILSAWREAGRYSGLGIRNRLHAAGLTLDLCLPRTARELLRQASGHRITPRWLSAPGLTDLGVLLRYPFNQVPCGHRIFWGLSDLQLTHSTLPALLHYEDRNSMAHSLEARVPFLDFRLVEFLSRAPNDHKVSGGETKRILREGLRGILPEEVRLRRNKIGFTTPEARWLRTTLADFTLETAGDAARLGQGLFDSFAVNRFARDVVMGRQPYNSALWRVLCFGEWMRRFNVAL
jgi:asparagine synthase (glutamine-hydrolysing)